MRSKLRIAVHDPIRRSYHTYKTETSADGAYSLIIPVRSKSFWFQLELDPGVRPVLDVSDRTYKRFEVASSNTNFTRDIMDESTEAESLNSPDSSLRPRDLGCGPMIGGDLPPLWQISMRTNGRVKMASSLRRSRSLLNPRMNGCESP